MKKTKFLLLALLLLIPITSKAATIDCSGPGTVVSGNTFTVTFSGRLSNETATWQAKIGSEGNVSYVSGNLSIGVWGEVGFSRQVTYKAGNPGTARIYAYDVDVAETREDGPHQYRDSSSCNITVVAANSSNSNNNNKPKTNNNNKKPDPNKSSNNNLKSITIENVELNPEFNKDTLEYSAVVEGDIEKITINAEAEDGKSSIDGLGEKDLQEGLNEITLYVNAENGDVKEYKINITRKEKNPIIVTIDGKKYTVVKKETEMELPEGYNKETIMINDMEVTAYTNEKVGRTLVVLVDEEGNTGFFIYDNKKDTYTEFKEFDSKKLKILITSNPGEAIPFGYKKITFTINGQKVDGYCYKTSDKFRLVYGVDLESGDEGFYQYDMKQKTFQRYNGHQLKDYVKYAKYALYAAGGLLLLFLIFFVSTISLAVKNRKLKKNNKEEVKEAPKKKEEPKEEVKEETKPLTRSERLKLKEETAKEFMNKKELGEVSDDLSYRELRKQVKQKEKEEMKLAKKEEPKELTDTKTEVLDKRELKRLQKEKERKLKEEADNFLK